MGEGPVTLSWSEKVSRIVEVLQSELDEEVEAAVDFESVTRAFGAISDMIARIDVDALLAAIDEHDERNEDVNRRRHGSASVCPRHGETKGGLCRKCRR